MLFSTQLRVGVIWDCSYHSPRHSIPNPLGIYLLVAMILVLRLLHASVQLTARYFVFFSLIVASSLGWGSSLYQIHQVTSDAVDHQWPSLNNLGHLVWSQKDASGLWQVMRCVPVRDTCDASSTQQVTTGAVNHERPVISDDGTIVWFQDGTGGGVGYQVIRREPSGSESIVELSTRNSFTGDQRVAGKRFGISSDGRTISHYTFFQSGIGRRRFNVSGIGELQDGSGGRGNFAGLDYPDINKELAIVYSDDFAGVGNIYRATTATPFSRTVVDVGQFPRIADGAEQEIVYVKSGRVMSTVGGDVGTGSWADVNRSGAIVFENVLSGVKQVFLARRGGVDLLDPVPDLVDSAGPLGLTSSADMISSMGPSVEGVAADGAARLVIRIPARFVGETFRVKLLTAEPGNTGNTPGVSHDVGSIGASGSFSEVVTSAGTSSGHAVAWAIYRAPKDFVRPLFHAQDAILARRHVTLRVETSSSGALVEEMPIAIVRPPVNLIHGLWADRSTWDHFVPLFDGFLPMASSVFEIGRVNYQMTNSEGFFRNAQEERSQLRHALLDFKRSRNVAAVRFDVVAHSMGGLVTRMLIDMPDYSRPANFGEGDVHKLITIDTPHAGSELAPRLLASNSICKFFWGRAGQTISAAGAIGDLVPGSLALYRLALQTRPAGVRQLPTHVVAGVANTFQTSGAESAYFSGIVSSVCPSILPSGGYRSVFGGDNDLLVGLDSMLAFDNTLFGLHVPLTASGTGEIPQSGFFNFVHTVNPTLFPVGPDVLGRELDAGGNVTTYGDRRIQLRVIELLNEPSYGPLFKAIRPGGM